jgi:protein-tyrosine phosphatase
MSSAPEQRKQVLFLCSGNYYRSRYAEILFNHLAEMQGVPWRASSCGLELSDLNPGPLSQHTRAALARLGIPIEAYLRPPRAVSDQDFESASHIVAVKEAEHRNMILRKFPHRLKDVEFWHVHDLDCGEPAQTTAHLDGLVSQLLQRLSQVEAV